MKLLLTLILAAGVSAGFGQSTSPIVMTPAAPVISDSERQTELASRREKIVAAMEPNSVLVLFSGEPRIYAGGVDYVFRQENDLYYLTALKQTGSALVIAKQNDTVTETLYLPKRIPSQETWTGRMYSVEDAVRLSGIKKVEDATTFPAFLDKLRSKDAGFQNVYLLLPKPGEDEDAQREYRRESEFAASLTAAKPVDIYHVFASLRQIKSPYEIKLLQHAIDISTEAHTRSWATAGRAKMEYEIQAEVEYTFRRRNADYWGYPSIVGCGPNATTLHYEESQGPVTPGSLLLMDVGAEYDHYSADVTRTFPVNGKFTKEQADIYQIVYDAQEAAAAAAKPGASFSDVQKAADAVLRDGLFKLGLTTKKDSNQLRLWYFHGIGHWLGMNVHDLGPYDRPLAPGMVFTNEPGIYIRADALDQLPDTPEAKAFKDAVRPAFEKYKNIGVRIEDDMLVTPTGVDWLTKRLPRKMSDIEAFMAAAKRSPVASFVRNSPSQLFPYLSASVQKGSRN